MSETDTGDLDPSLSTYAGRTWFYSFRHLPQHCEADDVTLICQRLSQTFAPIAKSWDDDKNSEWISRIYFAAKMILGASVMAQSLEYASSKNLRIVTSYLDYYTVLHILRAVMLTNPSIPWDGGKLLETTHAKTINMAIGILSQYDKSMSEKAFEHITELKAFRELISYRAPSSGDRFKNADIDVIGLCRLFAEVAQLQSEIIEASVLKHTKGKFVLLDDAISRICKVQIDGHVFFDKEDCYRMDYLKRKHPLPTNIRFMMTDGHVEDFFGSWCSRDDIEGQFSPDDDWSILFNIR